MGYGVQQQAINSQMDFFNQNQPGQMRAQGQQQGQQAPQAFNPNPNPAQRFNGQLDLSGMMSPQGAQGQQQAINSQMDFFNQNQPGQMNAQGQQPPQNMAQMGANSGGGKSAGASNTGGSYGGGKSGR
jgi:hypothetical protein